jgi:hypothetical protein
VTKEDIKPIVGTIVIIILMISFGLIWYKDRSNPSRNEFIMGGTLIGKKVDTVGGISQGGSTLGLVYTFVIKLDSGEEIRLINQPFCSELNTGSKVKIYWHKSLLFKKEIYDYCKPF